MDLWLHLSVSVSRFLRPNLHLFFYFPVAIPAYLHFYTGTLFSLTLLRLGHKIVVFFSFSLYDIASPIIPPPEGWPSLLYPSAAGEISITVPYLTAVVEYESLNIRIPGVPEEPRVSKDVMMYFASRATIEDSHARRYDASG